MGRACAFTSFEDFLAITRLLRAYMVWHGCEAKVIPTALRVRLASDFLCTRARPDPKDREKRVWELLGKSPEISVRRLKSAGIDPVTWEITSQRRAAFAWKQIRESGKYSEREQARLVKSGEATPSLVESISFDWEELNKKNAAYYEKRAKGEDKTFKESIYAHLSR